jgi:hypothetical protein
MTLRSESSSTLLSTRHFIRDVPTWMDVLMQIGTAKHFRSRQQKMSGHHTDILGL